MIILLAVIVGYLLGVIPFILPKILEKKKEEIKVNEEVKENKETQEILDEWLNGAKKTNINQADIYNEYVTGKETVKGD